MAGLQPLCPICTASAPRRRFAVTDLHSLLPGEWSLMRCGACTHEWIHPRPSPEEMAAFYRVGYWEAVETDGWGGAGITVGVRRLMETLWAHHAGGRLLDIGCGGGRKTAALRDRGFRVMGLEPFAEACQVARETHGVEVVQGLLADDPLPDSQFDAITFFDVLEHVQEPVADLRRVRALLKPGGTVGIKVPHIASWQGRVMGPWWAGLDAPRHLHQFTRPSLRRALQTAGFHGIQCTAIADPAGATTFEVSMLLWLRGLAWKRGGGPAPAAGDAAPEALGGVYSGVPSTGKRAFRWFLRNIAYLPLWPENVVGRSVTLLATGRA